MDIIPTIKEKFIIVTDPPFNIGYHYNEYPDIMKEDDNRPEDEIIIVEDKSKLATAEPDDADDDQDERPNARADDDATGDTDDEREAIRERRRLEKLERK